MSEPYYKPAETGEPDPYAAQFESPQDAEASAEEDREEAFESIGSPQDAEASAEEDREEAFESIGEPEPVASQPAADQAVTTRRKRVSGAGLVIGLLLALLGFTLVVQVKSNSTDANYAAAREGDLLQIMSDLDASEKRLQQEIASLQQTQRELQSGAAGQEAALSEAKARADDLGILAGTLPARGPGVAVRIEEVSGTIKAASMLNAIQELRGGGAEAIQIDGTGGSVRVIASTSFVDADGGIRVDGKRLTGPYTILAIGDPETLSKAVQFAGGVVPRVKSDGGNVIVNNRDVVDIKEVRPAPDLQYARPAS
jgi:uncharacterized protein YlxW (UPF0749 family)